VAAPARQEVVVKGEARGTAPNAVAADAGKAAPEVQAGPAGGVAAQASSAIALRDLPIAIQQELPPMSISVHAWSAIAAQRLVGINNRLLHEGDEVAPGLRLEQITPNGMILNYKGYKFSRGVH
jgi:general secretion pathway protein B